MICSGSGAAPWLWVARLLASFVSQLHTDRYVALGVRRHRSDVYASVVAG